MSFSVSVPTTNTFWAFFATGTCSSVACCLRSPKSLASDDGNISSTSRASCSASLSVWHLSQSQHYMQICAQVTVQTGLLCYDTVRSCFWTNVSASSMGLKRLGCGMWLCYTSTHDPLKCWCAATKLHGVTTQMTRVCKYSLCWPNIPRMQQSEHEAHELLRQMDLHKLYYIRSKLCYSMLKPHTIKTAALSALTESDRLFQIVVIFCVKRWRRWLQLPDLWESKNLYCSWSTHHKYKP
jgi:hypothetical protein